MGPVPIIYTASKVKKSPPQSPAVAIRKPPKAPSILPESQSFRQSDRMSIYDELDDRHAPLRNLYHKVEMNTQAAIKFASIAPQGSIESFRSEKN